MKHACQCTCDVGPHGVGSAAASLPWGRPGVLLDGPAIFVPWLQPILLLGRMAGHFTLRATSSWPQLPTSLHGEAFVGIALYDRCE